ncbi:hypothetical protein IKP13_03845, partial [bacterium]|nr:hypothetical protein [bacterium]
MKATILFLLIFSLNFVFAENDGRPDENTGNTETGSVETFHETSLQKGETSLQKGETSLQKEETSPQNEQKSAEKPKNEEIKWKFYSKNKAHVFIDEKIQGGAAKDTYGVLQTEDFGEITYKNWSFGIRKTLLFFADKEYDEYVNNFDYVYSHEHFNHCWEQYLDRIYAKGKWKNIQFTAGDFYESMNRGMAFSMKNDQVYGDNSIRGGNIAANYNGFFIKAFGGRANPE